MVPKVSVIVPIYNVEKYLRRCIDSILNQSYKDYELILVDDGSPDNCPAICDEYAENDDRIVVIHKLNGGLSDARNAGLDIAKGEYIYFCDSDDYIDKEFLSTVIPYMENGYDMTVVQFHRFDENDRIFYSSKMELCDYSLNADSRIDFILNYLLAGRLTWGAPFRLYRRSIIKEHRLRFVDNKKIFAEDLYFCLCYCGYCDKLCHIDDALYYYFQRNNSIMGKDEFIGNVDRFSLLAEAVYDTWKKDISTDELINSFPIVYYSILYIELRRVKNNRQLSDKQVREYLFSHLPNIDFFMKNLPEMKDQLDIIDHGEYDKEYHRKAYELIYWQDNSYIRYKIKCICYNAICDIRRFFCKIPAFIKYRTKKMFHKA